MNNADKPAMPISVSSSTHGNICSSDFDFGEGLTKREHFAGLAMQGFLAHYGTAGEGEVVIGLAIYYADELLKALENSND